MRNSLELDDAGNLNAVRSSRIIQKLTPKLLKLSYSDCGSGWFERGDHAEQRYRNRRLVDDKVVGRERKA
jgi:hypothetical protein